MAEANTLDDLTHCPICFNTYDRPRFLPCLHTFCEECLQTYINTTLGKDLKSDGFHCPSCRRFIEIVENDELRSSRNAENFPMNHLIVSLMDINTAQECARFCGPCRKRSNEVSPVSRCSDCKEFLCGQCVEYHKTLPILEGHVIESIGNPMKITEVVSSFTFSCDKHPEKKLEMYCEDHEVPCCLSCTMIEHRKCEKVETLEKVAKSQNLAKLKDELSEKFSQTLKDFDDRILSKNDSLKRFNEQCDEMENKVEKTTEEITDHMRRLRSDALEELSSVKEKQELLSTSEIDLLKERKCSVEKFKKLLSDNTREVSQVQLFMELRRLTEYLERIPKEKAISNDEVELKHKIVDDIFDILAVKALLQTKGQEASNTSTDSSSTEDTEIDVQYKSISEKKTISFEARKKNASVTNCVYLKNGNLMIVDYKIQESRNGIIRIYNSELSNFRSINLTGKPWAAVELNEYVVAITIPSNETICYLETATCNLTYQKCERKFFGIAVKEKLPMTSPEGQDKEYFDKCTFYVSSKGEVHLRTFSGNTLQKLSLSSTYIRYISYCHGMIYFSVIDSLYCFDEDRGFKFEFNDPRLQGASGSAIGLNGDIAVCAQKSGVVIIISKDGKRKTEIAIHSARCVAFSSDCFEMCIVQGGKNVDNIGFVFEIEYDE